MPNSDPQRTVQPADNETLTASGLSGERDTVASPATDAAQTNAATWPAAIVTNDDKLKYPGLAVALEPGPPSFEVLVTARYYSTARAGQDVEQRQAMGRFYPSLVASFSKAHGLARHHWCNNLAAGAALSPARKWRRKRQRIWIALNPGGTWPAVEDLLARCVSLNHDIEDALRGASRSRCQDMLYEVVTSGLAMLDHRVGTSTLVDRLRRAVASDSKMCARKSASDPEASRTEPMVAYIEKRFKEVQTQFERAARRTLQLRYIFGLLVAGIAVAGVVIYLIGADRAARHLGVISGAAGATGAVVSTLARMSDRHGLQLDIELGPLVANCLGFVRTLLGVAFGVLTYFLLVSGVPALKPPDSKYALEFYCVLAFAAGFSERLVPDTMGVVGALVAGRRSVEPETSVE